MEEEKTVNSQNETPQEVQEQIPDVQEKVSDTQQTSVEAPKKSKKWLIIGIAAVAVAIVAILLLF